MKNYSYLNLDIPLFKNGVSENDVPKLPMMKTLVIADYINPELVKFFDTLNLQVTYLASFFKNRGHTGSGCVHVDDEGGDYVKLNWVFGAGESLMCWYEPKDNFNKSISINVAKRFYVHYEDFEVNLIESAPIKNPTIVQVGIPHNIINVTEDRLCISVVICIKGSRNRLPMQQALDIFKDYI
jgi:hypothetical protein